MAGLEKQSDQQLIGRCLRGDERAWQALILRYERLIYSIPVRYGFDQDSRADIFQTVSLRLLEELSQLRDRSKLASWLITTTLRECWKRKREASRLVSDGEAWQEGEEPSEQARAVEERQLLEEQYLVRQGLQRLDERCRRLLELQFYADVPLSYQQISDNLQIPIPSIGPTRGRCLEKLRQLLRRLGYR